MIKTLIHFKGKESRAEIWTGGLHAALGQIVDAFEGGLEVTRVEIDLNPNPDEIKGKP